MKRLYTVYESGVRYYDVETVNYHGYRVFGKKPFRYTTKTEFVFSEQGVFASPTFCIADEYAIERYKNHP